MANATLSKDEILEAIGNMSVFDLADLIDAFKTKFNVTIAAAPAAAAPAAGGAGAAGAAAAVEEQTEGRSEHDDRQQARWHDRDVLAGVELVEEPGGGEGHGGRV